VGQTILDVARLHKVDLEGPCGGGGSPREVKRTEEWTEYTYGEGPNCFFCHVQIPTKFNNLLPSSTEYELQGMADEWDDECTKNSHLACQITLDKRHDGLVVFVPDAPPTDLV
jgi:ferredoxin-2, mitochondrial